MKRSGFAMSGTSKKRLAAKLFPRHIGLLEKINANALFARWLSEQQGRVVAFENVYDLYHYINKEVCGEGAIDFLEFGVYKGNSIRLWSEMNRDPQSRFVGFDSFEGLPEGWTRDYTQGAFNVSGAIPDIGDERVSFVKGWFQSTLLEFLKDFTPRSRLIVHNDSDLYSSTLFTLVNLHPLLVRGTVIIFDEYSSALHEFRAFGDYQKSFLRSATPIAITSDYADQVAFLFD